MGNVIQRLTHRGGEFRLTQVNEAPSSGKPTITVTDDSTDLPQDDDLQPNGGDILFLQNFKILKSIGMQLFLNWDIDDVHS